MLDRDSEGVLTRTLYSTKLEYSGWGTRSPEDHSVSLSLLIIHGHLLTTSTPPSRLSDLLVTVPGPPYTEKSAKPTRIQLRVRSPAAMTACIGYHAGFWAVSLCRSAQRLR
jgi:hypothetical protein